MSGTTQANPQIPLGTINRLRASITVPSFPELNVTASYLGRDGISVNPEGEGVTYLPVLSGAVPSPEAFQMIRLRIMLIKTQPLIGLYITQYQLNAVIGDVNVKPDTTAFPTIALINASIINIPEMRFSGATPDVPVELRGYWQINSSLFNPV